MSAISPFVRVLRAEATALEISAATADQTIRTSIAIVVEAKRAAADQLEAEEREVTERINGR